MSWSIEEHIGDCRPFPAQVVVYRGETDECLAYVSGEVTDRLKAENAQLRELVRDMMRFFEDGDYCTICEKVAECESPDEDGSDCLMRGVFRSRMDDMGLEVES